MSPITLFFIISGAFLLVLGGTLNITEPVAVLAVMSETVLLLAGLIAQVSAFLRWLRERQQNRERLDAR